MSDLHISRDLGVLLLALCGIGALAGIAMLFFPERGKTDQKGISVKMGDGNQVGSVGHIYDRQE